MKRKVFLRKPGFGGGRVALDCKNYVQKYKAEGSKRRNFFTIGYLRTSNKRK